MLLLFKNVKKIIEKHIASQPDVPFPGNIHLVHSTQGNARARTNENGNLTFNLSS